MTRPWGFFMRWRRDRAAYPQDLRRWLGVKSLSSEVARDPVDSHGGPSDTPFLAQTLGRLSVSPVLVNRSCSRPFGPNLPGLAFGVEKSMRESITNKRESAVTGGVMLLGGF